MDLDLTSAAVASLALGALSLSLVVGFQLCAWLQLRRARATGEALPPVSVLKPIKGVDAGLRDNLEAFAAQDYPSWELLIAIAEPDDRIGPGTQLVPCASGRFHGARRAWRLAQRMLF